jgi:pimeloyl-ACP methyl ester carboxylesterase
MNDFTSLPSTHSAGLALKTWGKGPPLVLLHGGMGSWNHWTRNIDALAARYTVHALDLPGCGDSPSVPREIADDAYVDLVIAAVGNLAGSGTVRLAGFSFGGITAALVAARMGARIGRLSLLGPGGFGKSGVVLDLRKIPPDEAGIAAVRDVLRHNLRVMMCAQDSTVTEETIDLHYANVRRTRFDGRRFSLGNHIAEALARITCPVQVIWGERDVLPYPSLQPRIDLCRAIIPGIRLDIIPEAGHWVQYEAPQAVNEAMIAFLADDGKPAAAIPA